jgi:hypothetical protein
VVDLLQAASELEGRGNVVLDILEGRVFIEVGDVPFCAGAEVICADHVVAFGEETLAEVATEETGAARDERAGTAASVLTHVRSPCSVYPRP